MRAAVTVVALVVAAGAVTRLVFHSDPVGVAGFVIAAVALVLQAADALHVGAQDIHAADKGAHTGCLSAPMVKDAYIADLIATLAALDPFLGGIDR